MIRIVMSRKINNIILRTKLSPKLCRSLALTFLSASILFLNSGCTDKNEPDPDPESKVYATSILLYAVASNNLSYDFLSDMQELTDGARQLDLSRSDIWIYSLTPKDTPSLRHIVKDSDGKIVAETVKEYSRDSFSTDPKRISEVIGDYLSLSPASDRGLIMWSHATGWQPNFSDHIVPSVTKSTDSSNKIDLPANYSFGADNYLGTTDYCDILELDEAIPADTFDYIWFDCCYMSAIEVLYQLRDKAPYIVAYPTEVSAEGMPYDLTIPHMAKAGYDIEGAARAMSKYYLDKNAVITIAITDTSALPELAEAAKTAVLDGNDRLPILRLQRYHRNPNGPFVDLGHLIQTWGEAAPDGWAADKFEAALDKAVIYKEASANGFDRRPIDPENYSGISSHYFEDFGNEKSEYYKRLDWFRDVYTNYYE